ncbi:MAG: response regulator [bacterium]|nr:response regulator [bacterium]
MAPTPPTPAAPAAPVQPTSSSVAAGQTILLAEDDHVLQTMYQERLKAEGFKVVLAVDGEQALAQVESAAPALIILDIMMPKMNGIDVLKKLKSSDKTKNIPVIVATALVQDMTELKKLLTTNDAYLIKSEVMPGDVVKLVHEKLLSNPTS